MNRVTRRGVVAAAAVALAGCSEDGDGTGTGGGNGEGNGDGTDDGGGDADEPDNPALASAESDGAFSVSSSAFDDGGEIPRKYGNGAENINPPLAISNVPDDAESLAIVIDDPDAVDVVGEIFVHWLVWNVPADTTSIPEDWSAESAVEGENDFGSVGYGGPAPPDEPHTYRFKGFALDAELDLEAGATVEDLGPALSGHIIARAQTEGTYAP